MSPPRIGAASQPPVVQQPELPARVGPVMKSTDRDTMVRSRGHVPTMKDPLKATPPKPGKFAPVRPMGDGSRVLAQVGDALFTERTVSGLTETVGTQATTLAVYTRIGRAHGVTIGADEDVDAFQMRVQDAVALAGDAAWDELFAKLDAAAASARKKAGEDLMTLLQHALLRKRAEQEKLPLPAQGTLDKLPYQSWELKIAIISKMIKDAGVTQAIDPDDEYFGLGEKAYAPFGNAYDTWLQGALDDALWAPFDKEMAPVMARFDEQAQEGVKDYLGGLYGTTFGVLAQAEVTRQLTQGGDAFDLVLLMQRFGRVDFCVGDLLAASTSDPQLRAFVARTFAALRIRDPLAALETPVRFKVAASGRLVPERIAIVPNPVFAGLRDGSLVLHITADAAGLPALTIGAALGVHVDAKQAAAALRAVEDQVALVADGLEAAWTAKQPLAKAVHALAEQVGLSPYLKDENWLLYHPALQTRLAELTTRDALAGKSETEIRSRIAALGVAEPLTRALLDREKKSRILRLSGLIPQPPYALAQAQRLLVTCGMLDPSHIVYGQLDEHTKRALWASGWAERDDVDDLTLNGARVQALANVCVSGSLIGTTLLGDLLLRHPAMAGFREHAQGADPLRFIAAYLQVSGRQVDPRNVDAAFVEAMLASMADRFDPARAKAAGAMAARLPLPERLEETLATEIANVSGTKVVLLDPVASSERRAMARRWEIAVLPMAERSIGATQLAELPINEPVLTMKLALAKINGGISAASHLFNADGIFNGMLTAEEVLGWRALYFSKAVFDPVLDAAFVQLAEDLAEARCSIDTLNDIPGKPVVNRALAALRGIVQIIAASTLQTDRGDFANARMISELDAPSTTPYPLLASLRLFGLPAGPLDKNSLAVFDVKPELLGPLKGVYPTLKQAILKKQLIIREGRVDASSETLRAQGEQLRSLFIAAADQKQAERVKEESAGEMWALRREIVSVREHLFTLPSYAPSVVLNQASDWLIVSLRREMALAGKKPLPDNLAGDPKQRRELFVVDADVLDFVADNYGSYFDDKLVTDVMRGGDKQKWSAAEVQALLRKQAARMRSGERWPSINVDWGDTDKDVTTAKLFVQLALSRKAHGASSNAAVLAHGVVEAVGVMEKPSPLPLKAWLIETGTSLSDVGDLNDPAFSPAALRALGALGKASKNPKARQAAAVLIRAGTSAPLRKRPDSEIERALGVLLEEVPQGSRGSVGTFDFAAIFGRVPGTLKVRSPGGNRVIGDTQRDFATIAGDLGRQMPWTEQLALDARAWWKTADFAFDFDHIAGVGMQTLLTGAQFRFWIPFDFSQAIYVRPVVQGVPALWDWITAENEEQARRAKRELISTGGDAGRAVVSITTYFNPIGLTQELWHDMTQGHIVEALGKTPVFAPIIYLQTRMVLGWGKRLAWDLPRWFMRRGKHYTPVGVTHAWAEPTPAAPRSIVRALAGRGYSWARRGFRLSHNPQRLVTGPVRALWRQLRPPPARPALPRVAVEAGGSVPSLRELADRPKTLRTWSVILEDGTRRSIQLEDRQLLRLLARQGAGEEALRAAMRALKIEHAERTVFAILRQYAGADWNEVTAEQWRALGAGELRLRWRERTARKYRKRMCLPLGVSAEALLERATRHPPGGPSLYEGQLPTSDETYRVSVKPNGKVVVRTAEGPVTESPFGRAIAKAVRAKLAAELSAHAAKEIAVEAKQWQARFAGAEELTGREIASFQRFLKRASAVPPSVWKRVGERVNTELLKAQRALIPLRISAQLEGKSVGFKIVESVGRDVLGTAKRPTFWLVAAVGNKEAILQLGTHLTDKNLSLLEKTGLLLADVALIGGEAYLTVKGFDVVLAGLEYASPRFGGKIAGVARAAGTPLAVWHFTRNGFEGVTDLADLIAGYASPDEALPAWRKIGVADVDYIDWQDRDAGNYDSGETSMRIAYWYRDPDSPMHQIIRQLCGWRDVHDSSSPVRQPGKFSPNDVTTWREPVRRTSLFMRKLPQVQARLRVHAPRVEQFRYADWEASVTRVAQQATLTQPVGTKILVTVDKAAFANLLIAQDETMTSTPSDAPITQLGQRIASEVAGLADYERLLNQLPLPVAERQRALMDRVREIAGQHWVNSLLYDYYATSREAIPDRLQVDAPDYFLHRHFLE